MIRVAIVEDDIACSNELQSFLEQYQEKKNCTMTIECFENSDKFLQDYTYGLYQIIFMDIEMPGTDGMQAAKLLREKDKDVLLFFVTNLSQYALESYEVQAFNFMVKPVVFNDFFMKMERAMQRLQNAADIKIIVPVKETNAIVDKIIVVSKLLYVEVFDHNLVYHTTEGAVVAARNISMESVSKKLKPLGFSMCNKSFLVNLKSITAFAKDNVYIGDIEIKLSRGKREEFLRAVSQFVVLGRINK